MLDLLVSQDKLTEKVYGKQKVYTVNQSLFPDVSSADLKEMEKKISMLQEGLRVEEEAYRALETRELNYIMEGGGGGGQGKGICSLC